MSTAILPSNAILGYCTNVHAGTTPEQIRAELDTHALTVKRRVSPDAPMGVGLWFPFSAAMRLLEDDGARRFRDWLTERGLFAYTLNGFPFGDFHQPVVKHAVYEPDWSQRNRYEYTLALATILADLLPDDADEGSISTLPLGWPSTFCGEPSRYDTQAKTAARQLTDLVHQLARIELNTGKCIHIDLEPEPGCVLDTAPGLVKFFKDYLLGTLDDVSVRGYLRVCHDVCHSAVMFESQAEALSAYQAAGVRVGKVQLSSAIRVPLDGMTGNEREHALSVLRDFCEDRYLHQTVIRFSNGTQKFYADLPEALAEQSATPAGEWRIHFHTPLHVDRFGPIETTQSDIGECLRNLQPAHETRHFEVETYAYDVLPADLKPNQLADGIADELTWVRSG